MSTMTRAETAARTSEETVWALWARQTAAIMRLEVKKTFFSKRSLLVYLTALLPVVLMFFLATIPFTAKRLANPVHANSAFAGIYETFILRTVVFFGCAWIFMNLFRGEVVDKSLHYYFLTPVRREVLVAGKYLSGLVNSVAVFLGTTLISIFFLYYPRGWKLSMQYIFDGPGLFQIGSYLGIIALACVGYGAVFLAVGLLFRNPIIPALVIYGWEFINFLLPPALKKISITHYLQSLSPIPMSEGPFALIADPTPAWIAIPGLLIVTVLILAFACYRIRRMEIKYGTD